MKPELGMEELSQERIAVLAGGTSCEREISLISGKNVLEALTAKGLKPLWVDAVGDFIQTLKRENVTLAFLALHGTFGEDGTVQRLLQKEGILYTGPGPKASEIAFDKARSQALFRKAGIRVPDFVMFNDKALVPAKPAFDLPVVVKPTKAGSSVGVTIVREERSYRQAVEEAFRYSDAILVEKFIRGRELTVGILGQDALPVVEVIAQRAFYDYEAKYKDSGTRYEVPAKITDAERQNVQRMALDAYRTLGADMMSRVDLILAEDGQAYVLEVNTIPGLTAKSLLPKAAKEAGIDFQGLCVRILAMALARKGVAQKTW